MTALSDIRVLDLTRIFAGPWASQMLADFGADVVKVEHPRGGDDVRKMGFPQRDDSGVDTGETSSFLAVNRGKRSVTLDMTQEEERDKLIELATRADVLIENFKTGGLSKYGLDYQSISGSNPGLIYCSITGFGQDGPYAALPGYDPIFQAMSGLLSITGTADEGEGSRPALVGYSVSDINAGFYAAIAILAALHHRDLTGEGQHIDLALLDAQFAAHSHIAMNYLVSGKMPVRAGTASQINTPWQSFDTADRPLMIAVGNDRQFAQLCESLGIAGLASDPRFDTNRDRMANKPALLPLLQQALLARKASDWVEILNAVGISSGPLNDFGAAVADPQIAHRQMIREMPHPKAGTMNFIANPIRFSRTPVRYDRPPPLLGQHNSEVLVDWLGADVEDDQ